MTSEVLTETYKSLSDGLFRVAYYILESRTDAEDAVQETVITAFKQLSNLRDDTLFKSWLFKILSNQCKSQLKKKQKNPELLPEEDYAFLIEDENEEVVLYIAGVSVCGLCGAERGGI